MKLDQNVSQPLVSHGVESASELESSKVAKRNQSNAENVASFLNQILPQANLARLEIFHRRIVKFLNKSGIDLASSDIPANDRQALQRIIVAAYENNASNLESILLRWHALLTFSQASLSMTLNDHQWGEIQHFYQLNLVTDIDNVHSGAGFILPPAPQAARSWVQEELKYAASQVEQGESILVLPYSDNFHWRLQVAFVRDGELVQQWSYNPPGDGKCFDHTVKKALELIGTHNEITQAQSGSEIRSAIRSQIAQGGLKMQDSISQYFNQISPEVIDNISRLIEDSTDDTGQVLTENLVAGIEAYADSTGKSVEQAQQDRQTQIAFDGLCSHVLLNRVDILKVVGLFRDRKHSATGHAVALQRSVTSSLAVSA